MKEYHSNKLGRKVYHNNPNCTEGNNIEKANYTNGRGKNRKLCNRCKRRGVS